MSKCSCSAFPAQLDGARKRVDGEPTRRGDEPGALWAGEEQTAYVRLFYAYNENLRSLLRDEFFQNKALPL